MNLQEKINALYEAKEKLLEVIDILDEAVGDDSNVQAYLIDQLKIFASNDHGFLSDGLNIDKVILNLKLEGII